MSCGIKNFGCVSHDLKKVLTMKVRSSVKRICENCKV
ncbi:MAG: 50S ribosomal protein L36, partial [Candidatus Brocadiia bacterium]